MDAQICTAVYYYLAFNTAKDAVAPPQITPSAVAGTEDDVGTRRPPASMGPCDKQPEERRNAARPCGRRSTGGSGGRLMDPSVG